MYDVALTETSPTDGPHLILQLPQDLVNKPHLIKHRCLLRIIDNLGKFKVYNPNLWPRGICLVCNKNIRSTRISMNDATSMNCTKSTNNFPLDRWGKIFRGHRGSREIFDDQRMEELQWSLNP